MLTARPRHVLVILALVALSVLFLTSTLPTQSSLWTGAAAPSIPPPVLPELQDLRLALPTNRTRSPHTTPAESRFCEERFHSAYLEDLRANSVQYCQESSSSHTNARLTCFHTRRRDKYQTDSLCIAQGASLDTTLKKFTLDCDIRRPSADEQRKGLIPFKSIRGYWYETGPKMIFDSFFTAFNSASSFLSFTPTKKPIFTILLKREGSHNLWHSVMEIWSLTHTIDVLRLTADPETGASFFQAATDVPNTQVVILDNHADGPYFDLWTMLAGRPPVRLNEAVKASKSVKTSPAMMLAAPPGTPHNVIVPLAGAANPLWENDWLDRTCDDAPLLKLFVRRVLNHLNVRPFDLPNLGDSSYSTATPISPRAPTGASANRIIRLTYIDRHETRRMLHFDALLAAARREYPDVEVRMVDFKALSITEQVRLVHHETDILLGVHGAGLTHTMFLDGNWVHEGAGSGKAIVEIMPHLLNYKGFHNMARMLGHGYFMAKAHSMSKQDLEEERIAYAAQQEENQVHPDRRRRYVLPPDADSRPAEEEEMHEGERLHKRLDWHLADVKIEETEFLEVIGSAVRYVRARGDSTP